jgi:hypothetical protein
MAIESPAAKSSEQTKLHNTTPEEPKSIIKTTENESVEIPTKVTDNETSVAVVVDSPNKGTDEGKVSPDKKRPSPQEKPDDCPDAKKEKVTVDGEATEDNDKVVVIAEATMEEKKTESEEATAAETDEVSEDSKPEAALESTTEA